LIQTIKKNDKLDISCSGHLLPGESFKEGMLRELKEEIANVKIPDQIKDRIKFGGTFFKIGDTKVSHDTIDTHVRLGKIFHCRDEKKTNREVTLLYSYVVDDIKGTGDMVEINFEKEKISNKLWPGVEANKLHALKIDDVKREFDKNPDGYRSGLRQYFIDGIYSELKEKLEDNILSSIVVHKYIVPNDARLDLVIDEKMNNRIKADRKSGKTAFKDDSGNIIEDMNMNEIRKQLPTYSQLLPNDAIAFIPNGNLLWNDWFVAWKDGKVYHRLDEPIDERVYTMLVMWKNGNISIENIRFIKLDRQENNYKIIQIKRGKEIDITDGVEFATYGQKILDKEKGFVSLTKIYSQFEDLRHLFSFPRIKWSKIKDLGFKVSGNLSGSFYYGANYLIGENDLLEQASQGKVISFNFYDVFKEILIAQNPNNQNLLNDPDVKNELKNLLIEALRRADYRESTRVKDEMLWGEYKFIGDKLFIKLKEGIYPHTLIGIKGNEEVILYAIDGLSGRLGATYNQLQKLLKKDGIEEALLIANGGDALLGVDGQIVLNSPEGRDRFTSLLVVKY
jgi:hypothetical protein